MENNNQLMSGQAPIQNIRPAISKRKKFIFVVLGLVLLLACVPAYYLYGKKGLANIRCGNELVIAESGFLGSREYYMPGTRDYEELNKRPSGLFAREYFCTEAEAQARNYTRANYYEKIDRLVAIDDTNDPTICERPTSGIGIEQSFNKNYCYQRIAINTKNAALCENISDNSMEDDCYRDIAFLEKDIVVCARLSSLNGQIRCELELNASKTTTRCEELSGSNRVQCYVRASWLLGRPDLCEKIKTDSYYLPCQTGAQFRADSADRCNMFNLYDEREVCYLQRATAENNPWLCERIGYGTNEDRCEAEAFKIYAQYVSSKKDLSLCTERMPWPRLNYRCVGEVAVIQKNISLCDGIKAESIYDDGRLLCRDLYELRIDDN
jgi:hypothetical protein